MTIRLEDVRWATGGATIIETMSLDFAPDRVNVILGPNGAGKSTLMKIAAGRLRPTGGRVLADERDLATIDATVLARERAFLSQHVTIDFAISVEEVALMGRYPHFTRAPGRDDRRIVEAALALVDMAEQRHRVYSTLSGGEQQRVQLARVLAQVWSDEAQPPPRTIFLDEPIAGLDLYHQLHILEIVRGLSARGCTIIITLHDLNYALAYGDRLIFLRDGRLRAIEAPDAVTPELVGRLFNVGVTALDDAGGRLLRFHL